MSIGAWWRGIIGGNIIPTWRWWTKRTGYSRWKINRMGFKPGWIILHHSATDDGDGNNWTAITRHHMSCRYKGEIITPAVYQTLLDQGKTDGLEKPWSDVGYTFGIEMNDNKLALRYGRDIGVVGAHCQGFNDRSIGICLVGNYDKAAPDEGRLFFLANLCRQFQLEFGIPKDQVLGHRETFPLLGKPIAKSCPGMLFDLDLFRVRLRA